MSDPSEEPIQTRRSRRSNGRVNITPRTAGQAGRAVANNGGVAALILAAVGGLKVLSDSMMQYAHFESAKRIINWVEAGLSISVITMFSLYLSITIGMLLLESFEDQREARLERRRMRQARLAEDESTTNGQGHSAVNGMTVLKPLQPDPPAIQSIKAGGESHD